MRPPKKYDAPLAKELGEHTFRYSLYPYQGSWQKTKVVQRAMEVNNPLIGVVNQKCQGGLLPSSKSFIKVEPDNFILTALKKAEDGKDVILRGYEAQGRDSEIKIYLDFPVGEAWKVNLLEKGEERLKLADNVISFLCKEFEITTIRLRRD